MTMAHAFNIRREEGEDFLLLFLHLSIAYGKEKICRIKYEFEFWLQDLCREKALL